jgi:hypothetical protein
VMDLPSGLLGSGTYLLYQLVAIGLSRSSGIMFSSNGSPVWGSMIVTPDCEKFPVEGVLTSVRG